MLLLRMGCREEGLAKIRRAIAINEETFQGSDLVRLHRYLRIGETLHHFGERPEARPYLEQALRFMSK